MEVCRLCLDLIAAQGEAKLLDGEARDMVQVVAPELNLDVSDDPLACGECTESLAALFEFKSRCFEHEAEVREKVGERRGELTLRDALAGEAGGGGDRLEEPGGSRPKAKDRLCRTCLAPIECESFTVLQPSEPDAYLSSMLDMCLVEVDLELTKDPVMCENCLENLQKLHHFKSSCQDVEDKIVEYCETHKVKEGDTIELHKVLESEMAMPDVEMALVKKEPDEAGTSGAKVKTEKESDGGDASQGDEDMSDADDELKQEEIDIKSEAGTSDSDKQSCPMCGIDIDKKVQPILKNHQDGVQFFCSYCDNKSNSLVDQSNSVLNKARISSRTSRNTCKLCGHAATRWAELQKHLASSHQENDLYCCPNCNFKSKYYGNIQKHFRKTRFRCHICRIDVDSCKVYYDHMITIHGLEKEFQCKKCIFKSSNIHAFQRHQVEVHKNKDAVDLYCCPSCDYKTKLNSNFRNHIRRMHCRCHQCNFDADSRKAYNEHMVVVHGKKIEKEYKCKRCPFLCKTVYMLRRHRGEVHGDKDVIIRNCTRCDFNSPSQSIVTRHEKDVHDGCRTWKKHQKTKHCPLCPFKSNHSQSFMLHRIKVHGFTDVVKHKCSRCSFTTLHGSNLKRHEQRIHDNVRIKCEYCDYSTKEISSLRKHVCLQPYSYNLSEQSNL